MTSERKFGLSVGTAFLLLAAITLWRGHPQAFRVLGAVGTALVLAGALVPAWLAPVERAWMAMAQAISKVTTPILMGVAYYLSVVPIGLAMRMFGKNPIAAQEQEDGFWHDRRKDDNLKSDLDRQF